MLESIDLDEVKKTFIREHLFIVLFDEIDSVAIKNKLTYQILSILTLMCSFYPSSFECLFY